MTQYAFYFDNSRCTGCRTCTMACKDYKDLDETQTFRRVFDYEGGSTTQADDGTVTSSCFMYHLSMSCNHCTDPACVANCPQNSMQKDEETGLVYNDPETCIGCGMCVQSCPYETPFIDAELKISRKCNGCAERVEQGLKPICVEACPLRALDFGTQEEMWAKWSQAADSIAPMPVSETGPNIVIKVGPAALEAGSTKGSISNEKEVTGVAAREIV